MRSIFYVTIALTFFGCAGHHLLAADHSDEVASSLYPVHALTCPDALLRGCCGNYCPKPTPCIYCLCHGCGPDHYCRKPCPTIRCFQHGCGVGYCAKPCPDLCRPLAGDFFICVPGCCGGAARPKATEPAVSMPETAAANTNGQTGSPSELSQPRLKQ